MSIRGLSKEQKEKVHAALARARGGAAHLAKGAKGTIYSGAVGAGCFYAGRELYNRFDIFKKSPYALPITFLVAGHFLKRKQYDAGAAMVGVAGFVGAQTYDANKQQQQGTAPSPGTPPGGTNTMPGAPTSASAVMGYQMLDMPMLTRGGAGAVIDPSAGAVVSPARAVMELSDIDDRRY